VGAFGDHPRLDLVELGEAIDDAAAILERNAAAH
jgi:hypothetical protein